jgi:hypothetical protein
VSTYPDTSETHDFEIYSGTHTSQVDVRFQECVMPFFGRTLSFDTSKAVTR